MLFLIFMLIFNSSLAADPISEGVVKIYVEKVVYAYYIPWVSPMQTSVFGSGFIVQGNRVVTNAHVASNSTFVQVKKAGDFRKYIAKVVNVSNDVDLAVLEVLDNKFFENTKELEIGDTPRVGDDLTCYGFPIGGEEMSLTKGVVSRVEMIESAQSGAKLLACDIDTSITFGSSGGPAISGGKVVGVVFQGLNNKEGGYIISAEVLKTFLKAVDRGVTYKVPELGITTQSLENPTMRAKLNLGSDVGGVYVNKIADFSPAMNILKVGDVIVKIDRFDVAENATVEFRIGERTDFEYAYRRKFINDKVDVEIWRSGKIIKKSIKLDKNIGDLLHAAEMEYNVEPAFLIKSGVVFQPLVKNLAPFGRIYPERLNPLIKSFREREKPEIILIQKVLQDEATRGYESIFMQVVKSINGIAIGSLRDVETAFQKSVSSHTIELDSGAIIILDAKDIDETTERIAKNYGIDRLSARVFDEK